MSVPPGGKNKKKRSPFFYILKRNHIEPPTHLNFLIKMKISISTIECEQFFPETTNGVDNNRLLKSNFPFFFLTFSLGLYVCNLKLWKDSDCKPPLFVKIKGTTRTRTGHNSQNDIRSLVSTHFQFYVLILFLSSFTRLEGNCPPFLKYLKVSVYKKFKTKKKKNGRAFGKYT